MLTSLGLTLDDVGLHEFHTVRTYVEADEVFYF